MDALSEAKPEAEPLQIGTNVALRSSISPSLQVTPPRSIFLRDMPVEGLWQCLDRRALARQTPNMADEDAAKRNPPWSRDELILAFDLYMRHRERLPDSDSPEVGELSRELGRLADVLGHQERGEGYRNANGVYMKLGNFRRLDPEYTSAGRVGLQRGSKGDELVWNEFAHDIARLQKAAQAIRENAASGQASSAIFDGHDEQEIADAPEGRLVTRLHRSRERNRKLVQRKKDAFMKRHGRVYCEACGFDFEEVYGERCEGLIECHHTRPVHTLRPGDRTKLSDLVLVCSNCHRAIHAKAPWLSIEELRKIVAPGPTVHHVR